LDGICVGGDKGRFLSARISELAQDFLNYYNNFSAHGYDCADPEDDSYDDDYFTFKEKVGEIDQKLAAIVCQAMDDCHNTDSYFKLITSLGPLLNRQLIQSDIVGKYMNYVQMIDADCCEIKVEFSLCSS